MVSMVYYVIMDNSRSRIGIGITTWKRPEVFKLLLEEIKDLDDRFHFAFVFDGPFQDNENYDYDFIVKNFGKRFRNYRYGVNVGVAKAKNKCISLLEEFGDLDYVFLLDDDINILRTEVFDHYIDTAKKSKVEHLLFSHIDKNTTTCTLMLSETQGITTHSLAQGAFMFFTKNHLNKVGKFDENFKNAFEHIDMTFRSYNEQGLPFWFFLDALNSQQYIQERPGGESTITAKGQYDINLQKSALHWRSKYGQNVGDIPRLPVASLIDILKSKIV